MQQTYDQNIEFLDIRKRDDRFVARAIERYAVHMTLGQRIRRFRKERHLSQAELGRLVGAAQTTIAGYERDNSEPSMEVISRIAHHLGVSPGVIAFGGIDFQNPHSLNYAKVVGTVEVGAWRKAVDVAATIDQVAFVPHPNFPTQEQLAFRVSGSGCDKVVPDGGYVIAVPYELFPGGLDALLVREKPPLVIVERDRGGAFEYTVRELRQADGRLALHSCSTAADTNETLLLGGHEEGPTARIAFVVLTVIHKVI